MRWQATAHSRKSKLAKPMRNDQEDTCYKRDPSGDPARVVDRIVKEHLEDLAVRAHHNDLVPCESEPAQAPTNLSPRQRHVRDINISESLPGPFVNIQLLDRRLVIQIGTRIRCRLFTELSLFLSERLQQVVIVKNCLGRHELCRQDPTARTRPPLRFAIGKDHSRQRDDAIL